MSFPLITPSILSADFSCLGDEVNTVLTAGAGMIHFDVMDNHYVPNLTVGPCVLASLRKFGVTAPIDVHLMISPVDAMIPAFAKAGATYISIHPDTTPDVAATLALITECGAKPALALNPDTPLSVALPYLESIDMLLLMSVNPGFGGQAFIPAMLEKAREARKLINTLSRTVRLQMDGGINKSNIGKIAAAGVDTFVAGSAIFHSNDYFQTISEMLQEIRTHS